MKCCEQAKSLTGIAVVTLERHASIAHVNLVTICEDYGAFRIWSLAGGRASLEMTLSLYLCSTSLPLLLPVSLSHDIPTSSPAAMPAPTTKSITLPSGTNNTPKTLL